MWLCPKLGVFFSPLRPPEAWCFDLGTTMAHQHSRRPGGSSHHQYPEQSKTEEDVVIVGHRSGVYEVSCLVSRGIPVTRSVRSKRTTYHADLADTSTYPPPVNHASTTSSFTKHRTVHRTLHTTTAAKQPRSSTTAPELHSSDHSSSTARLSVALGR